MKEERNEEGTPGIWPLWKGVASSREKSKLASKKTSRGPPSSQAASVSRGVAQLWRCPWMLERWRKRKRLQMAATWSSRDGALARQGYPMHSRCWKLALCMNIQAAGVSGQVSRMGKDQRKTACWVNAGDADRGGEGCSPLGQVGCRGPQLRQSS